jgi:hypothetical protein
MAIHSAGFSIAGVNTAATNLLNLKAASTTPIRVVEIGVSYTVLSTTAYDLGIIRMNAVGTGTITSTAGAPHETGGTSTAVLETAWVTTRPTSTGSFFRRATLPLTLGATYIFPIATGIFVPVSGGLILQGISASGATTGTLEGYFSWDE